MSRSEIKRRLEQVVFEDYISSDEYHEKYFFFKRLNDTFPEIKAHEILRAIDYCNNNLRQPRKRQEYLNLLTNCLSFAVDKRNLRARDSDTFIAE